MEKIKTQTQPKIAPKSPEFVGTDPKNSDNDKEE